MNIKTFSIGVSALMLASCAPQKMTNNLKYPETKKVDHVDEYFGEKINDSYRW